MRAHFEQELQLLDRSLQGKVAQTAEARDTVKSDYLRLRAFEKLLVHDLLKEKEASEKVGNLLILLVKRSKKPAELRPFCYICHFSFLLFCFVLELREFNSHRFNKFSLV